MNQPVKVVITILIMAFLLWYVGGLREVGRVMAKMDTAFIFLALLVITVDRALMTFKWIMLLHARGISLPFLTAIKIYCASMVWGLFLPTTIGADAIRIASTSRFGTDSKDLVASVIMERMIGCVIALLLGCLGVIVLDWLNVQDSHFKPLWKIGGLFLIAATVMFLATFNQRAFDFLHGHLLYRFHDNKVFCWLKEFHAIHLAYKQHKRVLTVFACLTAVEQVLVWIFVWVIAIGLGANVGLLFMLGVMPLMGLISRIPITIDGWGVSEGFFILMMSLAGITAAEAFAISVAARLIQTASCLPWWVAHVVSIGAIRAPRLVSQESSRP